MMPSSLAVASPLPFTAAGRPLEQAVPLGAAAILQRQQPDGHWAYPLEADATIPAEFILLGHYLGQIDQRLHDKMAVYLRGIQEDHGGWPLYHRGPLNISASVKAYFALKCVGDSVDAPHMVRARQAILAAGGAAKSNVFTRIQLALFGAVPWRAVPVMPVEIMLLPRWFPFHLSKISYWSRTVIVPLLVLMARRPRARNPRNVHVDELFTVPPQRVGNWHSNETGSVFNPIFRGIDAILRALEPFMPPAPRRRATALAIAWIKERLNGEDGLGAIYPAMANTVMMYDLLGYPADHPDRVIAQQAVAKLVIETENSAYCQPCLSPVWDTGLALHALLDTDTDPALLTSACDWLVAKQILDVKGDWAERAPNLRPGGWAFQYANPHYPDVDDTAVIVMALDRCDRHRYRDAIDRATEWVLGLQSGNGGWGAFDIDNDYSYLNHIPFADHGALLDPPTADVTGRCLGMLAQLGFKPDHPALAAGIAYLRREQEAEGCWFGRWGTNYIYGTWSVLAALNACGIAADDPLMQRATRWLLSKQRPDGGWGEDGGSYWPGAPKGEMGGQGPQPIRDAASTPSQTGWALLALMAAGAVDQPAVAKGIAYLTETQKPDGSWEEAHYTAVGFPKVFYLRYHGYCAFFPLWALARYQKLRQGNATQVLHGI